MRRVLEPALPALMSYYGIRPWETDRLTRAEILTLLRALPSKDDDDGEE